MQKKTNVEYMLFVIPKSPKSELAHKNLLSLCGKEKVQIIDIMSNPGTAQKHGILATPTVIRTTDSLTIVGTLNDLERTAELLGLSYPPQKEDSTNV